MAKRVLLAIAALVFGLNHLFAQGNFGALEGEVKDDSGNPIPFANVVVMNDGRQIAGGSTNMDGVYKIKPIVAGTYDVVISAVGFGKLTIKSVSISGGDRITSRDFQLKKAAVDLKGVVIETTKSDQDPLINKDNGTQGQNFKREDVLKMPDRNPASVALLTGGVNNNGESSSFRGSRNGAVYFVDGVKIRGSAGLPQQMIQEVQVLLGGIPANIGDATGGVVLLSTRGIMAKYFGSLEARTSQFLDAYNNHLFQGTIGGPLAFKKKTVDGKTQKEAIIGFLVSAEGEYFKDSRPAVRGLYSLKDDVRNQLLANPLRKDETGTGTFYNSNYLRESDFNIVKARNNSGQYYGRFAAKLDFQVSKNTTFTVGGNGNFNRGRDVGYTNHPLNWQNPGAFQGYDFNVYGRLIQRFASDEKSTVKNAYISLQVDYSKAYSSNFDPRHKANLFQYGYLGKYDIFRRPTYEYGTDPTTGIPGNRLNGFQDTLVRFTPSDLNPELVNYTSQLYSLFGQAAGTYDNLDNIIKKNGLRNGDQPSTLYTVWNNPGTFYNGYGYNDNNQFRVIGMGSFDIKNHSIKVGFEFEQRRDNGYSVNPAGLWTIGRNLVNFHIREFDFNNPQFVTNNQGVYQDTINYNRLFVDTSQSFFDINLRKELGLNPKGTDFLNLDSYDPSKLSINMFSADELLNNGNNLVSYFGYDVYGNKLRGQTSLNDFFNKKDDNGRFTRNIGAFQPVYVSGYIMDKFSFKDLIFNLGVRVDRFDANQRVLKDPYTLYAARTAGEVTSVTHPSNIGSDYVVYVNDNNAANPTILGYRNGETWFNAQGQQINDVAPLRTSTGSVQPYLVNPNESVRSGNFNVDASFGDYKPQVNVMPRVAFSFPVGDRAVFTAHYDVLVQRPLFGVRLNPMDYFFMDNAAYNSGTVAFNNPSLRPEKTIDYSLGYQQTLGERSSIKISAYYREIRDQITALRLNDAFPRTYFTYRNIDFGTTKGLTITYDLRRTGNVRLTASYTLQFADGTYADRTSSINLNSAGFSIFRAPVPLNLDQRHFFNLFFDYSYGSDKQKDYNGPRIKGVDFLSNAGVTFTMTGGSGFPYDRSQTLVAEAATSNFNRYVLSGSINGSRLPWQFNVDMRVYKQFDVFFGGKKKKNGTERNPSTFEVYLQVLNLFNFRNVINVYRYTGNPTDDGYLIDAQSQNEINNTIPDAEAFRAMYAMRVNNPYNFAQPRRIRLGLVMNF
jgi:hypothetical protein